MNRAVTSERRTTEKPRKRARLQGNKCTEERTRHRDKGSGQGHASTDGETACAA